MSEIVTLQMDLRATRNNVLLTLPMVVIVLTVAVQKSGDPAIVACAGLFVGAWIGMAHNVFWGYLAKWDEGSVETEEAEMDTECPSCGRNIAVGEEVFCGASPGEHQPAEQCCSLKCARTSKDEYGI